MAGAFGLVSESLRKSFDLKIWLCYLLVSFLNLVVFFGTVIILLVPSAAIFYFFGFGTFSVVLWTIIGVVGVILFFYIGAVFLAILLSIAKDFSEKGKISLNEAWENALLRAPSLFFATTIITCFLGILLAFLMWPSFLPLADAFSRMSITPESIFDPQSIVVPFVQSLMIAFTMLAFFLLIALAVSPFTALVAPTVVFENVSAFAAIKKSVIAARQNYLRNLLSIIIYVIILAIINGFFFAVVGGLDFLGVPFSAMTGFPVISIALKIIEYILMAFSTVITLSFVTVFSVNYYKSNYFGFEPERQHRQKEEKKEPEEERQEEKESETEPPSGGESGAAEQGSGDAQSIKLEPWMGKRI